MMKKKSILIYVKKTYFISSTYSSLIKSLSLKFDVHVLFDSSDPHFDESEFKQIIDLEVLNIIDVKKLKSEIRNEEMSIPEVNDYIIKFIKENWKYDYFISLKNSEIFTSLLSKALRSIDTKICVLPIGTWPIESLLFDLKVCKTHLLKCGLYIKLFAKLTFLVINKYKSLLYRFYFCLRYIGLRDILLNPKTHLIWVLNNIVSPIDFVNTDVILTAHESNFRSLRIIYPFLICEKIKVHTYAINTSPEEKSLLVFIPYFSRIFPHRWLKSYNEACLALSSENFFNSIFYRFHPRLSTSKRNKVKKNMSFINNLNNESDLSGHLFFSAIKNKTHVMGTGETTALTNAKRLIPELVTICFSQKSFFHKSRSGQNIRYDVDFVYNDQIQGLENLLTDKHHNSLSEQNTLSIGDYLFKL
jgi:hypothetical protein